MNLVLILLLLSKAFLSKSTKVVSNSKPAWLTYGRNTTIEIENDIKLYQLFAAISHCDSTDFSWICTYCRRVPDTQFISRFHSEKTNMDGYIGFHPHLKSSTDKVIFVVFRGAHSSSWTNMKHVLQLNQAILDGGFGNDILVHSGVQKGYNSLKDQIRETVSGLLKKHPTARIVTTGVSLGSVLTTLCGIDLMHFFPSQKKTLSIYTYGGPRVGNKHFAKLLKRELGERYFRVTSGADPVVQIPIKRFNAGLIYEHGPREYWITPDRSRLIACNDMDGEDPNCSNSMHRYDRWGNILDAVVVTKSYMGNEGYRHDHGYFDVKFTTAC